MGKVHYDQLSSYHSPFPDLTSPEKPLVPIAPRALASGYAFALVVLVVVVVVEIALVLVAIVVAVVEEFALAFWL